MIGSTGTITILNSLITTTIDSVNGYEEAAEQATNERFSSMFRQFAGDRRRVVATLQDEVRRLGGTPEDDGSLKAAAHRGFLDLKNALTGSSDKQVIDEVERGEDYIKEKFETALNNADLSADARSVVSEAYSSIRTGHDTVRDLKHSFEGTGTAA